MGTYVFLDPDIPECYLVATMLRAMLIYIFSWFVMTIYGGEVCPFLETLSLRQWGLSLAVAFIVVFILRTFAARYIGVPQKPVGVTQYRGLRQFLLEFTPFLVMGFGVALFDWVYYGFPFDESGLAAVVVGAVLLGFFAAIDLTLYAERRIIRTLTAEKRSLQEGRRFFSLTRKFIVLVTALMAAMLTVTLMVISHDLYTSMQSDTIFANESVRRTMLYQVAFVMLTFFVIVLDLILAYSRNLRLLFENEIRVLERVDQGHLDDHVPAATNDEFGIIARYTNTMIGSLHARTEELQRTQDVTIHSLASLAETRDSETGAHIARTQHYVRVLATALQDEWQLGDGYINLLYKSAPLHDIGKVGVPDAVLLKPGPLTEEEWVEMKRHTEYGAQALAQTEEQLGSNSFLRVAREIAESHHERWDGGGYPGGLRGTDIPQCGRLMAIADVYDALISKRVYKDAFTHKKAREIIRSERGTHFDPVVVDAFFRLEDEFRRIGEGISDQPAGRPVTTNRALQ